MAGLGQFSPSRLRATSDCSGSNPVASSTIEPMTADRCRSALSGAPRVRLAMLLDLGGLVRRVVAVCQSLTIR
jgi:hypothetical protein